MIGPAARLLAATALEVFPNPLVSAGRPHDSVDATAVTVRRATAFIDANAHRDIGVAQIAAAAYVSPRAVQLAFRRKLDTTPTAYLRRVRLERARQQLLATDPGAYGAIGAIGARWGFARPGRFAALYRQEYGELPSDTLRR
ncbi:helix-turn-helix transcriptional regulator [Speluncibacter jeojiensis]|uniref:Helix-turn-helix transcriptional regulator n=1 Tax=Speluncibacter jeojiensis TaxID=2710754 RepID=A0A9X4RD75_9ACTN|nr:helix-turn-helix transcriptional regulator [Corynebacteriales bacterium D3-21]